MSDQHKSPTDAEIAKILECLLLQTPSYVRRNFERLLAERVADKKEIERLRIGVRCIWEDDLSTERVRHNRDCAIQLAQATARKLLAVEAEGETDGR